MKEQAKLPVMIVAVVALVGLLIFFGKKAMSAGDLDQGQVQYTPGAPPWADPLKKGAPAQGGGDPAAQPAAGGMGPPARG